MRIKLLAIMALAAVTVFALACGDDDDDSGDDAGDDDTSAETTAPADTGDGGGDTETVAIAISGFAFDPSEFTVPADTDLAITVSNEDSASHTFTVYTDAEHTEAEGTNISVGSATSAEGSGNFAAGEYFFRCDLHPAQMQGSFTAE